MKKFSILLFAIMMASSLFAQIDSFSESDNFVVEQEKMTFNKLNYLLPYEGGIIPDESDYQECNASRVCVNIIGEQIYLNNTSSNKYILTKNDEGLILDKVKPDSYYTVKDILITGEELDSLYEIFENLPYQYNGDTL